MIDCWWQDNGRESAVNNVPDGNTHLGKKFAAYSIFIIVAKSNILYLRLVTPSGGWW